MKKTIFILSFIIAGLIPAFSQQTLIYGNNKTYAGETIKLYRYNDLICKQKEEVGSISFDKNGDFSSYLNINNTEYIFAYFGIYKFEFYAEKGKDYKLIFPDKKEKTTADRLNPYFKYKIAQLGIANEPPNGLNAAIREFDKFYDYYIELNFNKIVNGVDSKLDSFIIGLKKHFGVVENKYFKDYMRYKIYYLDFLSYHKDYKYITQYFFKNQEILYNNTAYMELFNNLYFNFVFTYPATKKGRGFYESIALAKSPYAINEVMSREVVFSDKRLNNLIILKSLHDAFVADVPFNYKKYPKKSLIITLDSMQYYANNEFEQKIIKDIKKKFIENPMARNKPLPDAVVLDTDSNEVHLSSVGGKGKFTLISFTMTNCVPCQKDLEILKVYSEKYSHDLKIVTVIVNQDFLTMRNFLKKHEDYKWQFFHYFGNKEILNTYNIQSIPKYILLDPYGQMVMPSAPPPGESFIVAFRKIRQNMR